MKLTNHTCASNDVTSFEYVLHVTTGNGSYVNFKETHEKNLVKSLWMNLFLAGFSLLEPLCDARKTLFFVKLLCGGAYKLHMCVGEPVLCPSPHSAVTPETLHRSKM
jgi:hypothetical protein